MDKVGLSGKYQTYPEYKDSGVEWLGSVPMHWIPVRFKHRFSEKKKASNPMLDAGSISFGRVIYKSSENLAPETKASYQEVLEGEFLINPLNMNYDLLSLRTALSEINVVVSTGYIVIRSDERLHKRYVRWLLQEFDVAHMKTLGSGVRQTINYMDIGNSFFYEPAKIEQQKIASFLDHETAKIDTLIEKQQQLIKLLKEKRQAVISHAVTKGLNPNAPMRDSGVEWLGEVPEHWTMPKISHIGKVLNGSTPDKTNFSYWDDGTIPWLASGCLNSEIVVEPSDYISVGAYQSCSVELIPDNSLLVGMVGQGKTRGSSAILGIESCINQNMAAIIIGKKIKVKFIYFLFQAMYEDLRELGRGGNQAALNCEIISSVRIPLPPLHEQIAIVEMLDELLIKLNGLDKLAAAQIEILQERRTALISAAVTGKIDVRNWNGNAMECEI